MFKDIKRQKGYEVVLRNLETGQIFTKQMDSEYSTLKFVRKCKRSKRVRVLDVQTDGKEFCWSEV